jgi:hypothetical protein
MKFCSMYVLNCEELYLLGCNAMSGESQQTWQTPPSSDLKSKPNKGAALLCLLSASCWYLVWLTLQLWIWRWHVPPNVGWLSTDYTALYPSDRTYLNHCCENLRSYLLNCVVFMCMIMLWFVNFVLQYIMGFYALLVDVDLSKGK